MKRILGALSLVIVVVGGVVAAQAVEAGGGGHYVCDNDKKVSQTYDGPTLEVTVRDSCFGPTVARVAPGTELRWVNRGQQPHNLIDVNNPTKVNALQPGAVVSMTFAQAGAFVYYCSYHPGMTGAVFVGDSLGESNPEIASSSSASSVPPANAPLPQVAGVQLPPRDGGGVSALTVVLLALAVGTVAGGGSTLLTRRLDRR